MISERRGTARPHREAAAVKSEPAPITGMRGEVPSRDVQELWFTLAHHSWSSLTIVPADPGTPHCGIAESLADFARLLGGPRVTAIVARELDYRQAATITAVVNGAHRRSVGSFGSEGEREEVDVRTVAVRPREPLPPSAPDRVVVEVPALAVHPVGAAIAHASDLVVLTIEIGKTKLANVRSTVDLVGRERVAGCVLVR